MFFFGLADQPHSCNSYVGEYVLERVCKLLDQWYLIEILLFNLPVAFRIYVLALEVRTGLELGHGESSVPIIYCLLCQFIELFFLQRSRDKVTFYPPAECVAGDMVHLMVLTGHTKQLCSHINRFPCIVEISAMPTTWVEEDVLSGDVKSDLFPQMSTRLVPHMEILVCLEACLELGGKPQSVWVEVTHTRFISTSFTSLGLQDEIPREVMVIALPRVQATKISGKMFPEEQTHPLRVTNCDMILTTSQSKTSCTCEILATFNLARSWVLSFEMTSLLKRPMTLGPCIWVTNSKPGD